MSFAKRMLTYLISIEENPEPYRNSLSEISYNLGILF